MVNLWLVRSTGHFAEGDEVGAKGEFTWTECYSPGNPAGATGQLPCQRVKEYPYRQVLSLVDHAEIVK